ncbi:TPA: AbrB/MazE/SpoVT family DNA-binding domain-containing protein [Candidatus Micrarchaeota archaeon]|nr:AbrB/MazE/SpoVT family DNA-binding domain-containing protein [Candidatus Micrarchaeota archaeon]
MRSTVKVGARGRITIPKELRLKIGLTGGARYIWILKEDGIALKVLKRGQKE